MNSPKKSPAAATNRAAYQSTFQHRQNTESPITKLLSRLEKVRETGRGQYLACCPAHEDKSPSLSVRETSDGTVLIHCFAQCSPVDVLAAVGMELAMLFPDRNHGRPVPRGQRWNYRALLRQLRFESTVVICAANDVVQGQRITQADKDRLTQAAIRIARVSELSK